MHRFFERLLPKLDPSIGRTSYQEGGADHIRFVVHELFLYAFSLLLRFEAFEAATELVSRPYYYLPTARSGVSRVKDFTALYEYMPTLDDRNRREVLRRFSLRADLLKERLMSAGLPDEAMWQADFVLYLRAALGADRSGWHPETLVYAMYHRGPFEVFARARSRAYFARLEQLLGGNKSALDTLVVSCRNHPDRLVRLGHDRLSLEGPLGYNELATLP